MIIITTFLLIVSIIFPTWKISSLVRGMGGGWIPLVSRTLYIILYVQRLRNVFRNSSSFLSGESLETYFVFGAWKWVPFFTEKFDIPRQ